MNLLHNIINFQFLPFTYEMSLPTDWQAQGVCTEVQQRGGCREGASNLPLPTTPLLFCGGSLAPWEGS